MFALEDVKLMSDKVGMPNFMSLAAVNQVFQKTRGDGLRPPPSPGVKWWWRVKFVPC